MIKKILCLVLAIFLISVTGCDLISKAQSTVTTIPASVKAVREAKIGQTLIMKQMEINLESEVTIIVTVSPGNTVDGFFYLEKGNSVNFNISGISSMYNSPVTDTKTGYITSDRFAFIASQAQGLHYTLTLNPVADATGKTSDTTVFLEIIYPVTGSIHVPIGTK
jgi:hypothetical protein